MKVRPKSASASLEWFTPDTSARKQQADAQALEQVQERLRSRRAELQQRRNRIGKDLSRQNEPLVTDSSDRAIQLENDEPLQAIGKAATQEVEAIDAALARVAKGLYGVCEVCDQKISAERLRAVPYAVACEHCGNDRASSS